jgi:precorrin-6B methylase 2
MKHKAARIAHSDGTDAAVRYLKETHNTAVSLQTVRDWRKLYRKLIEGGKGEEEILKSHFVVKKKGKKALLNTHLDKTLYDILKALQQAGSNSIRNSMIQ